LSAESVHWMHCIYPLLLNDDRVQIRRVRRRYAARVPVDASRRAARVFRRLTARRPVTQRPTYVESRSQATRLAFRQQRRRKTAIKTFKTMQVIASFFSAIMYYFHESFVLFLCDTIQYFTVRQNIDSYDQYCVTLELKTKITKRNIKYKIIYVRDCYLLLLFYEILKC